MALCRQYQIPHSHFMGGPLRWTELDREKAMDYEIVLKQMCPKCGTLEEDWISEDRRPLDEPLMAATLRHCYGCEEVEKIQESAPKRARGVYPVVIPLAHLDDGDEAWFDSPTDLAKQQQDALDKARSLEG